MARYKRSKRKIPAKRKYASYRLPELECALREIDEGETYQNVSEKYGIAMGTLYRKKKKINMKKPGRPPHLSENEEATIVECLQLSADWGFPLDAVDLCNVVKMYLDTKGERSKVFKNNRPGYNWCEGFLQRHPELVRRLSANVKRARAAVDRKMIEDYFNELKESIADIPPERIINYDETNLADDPARKDVFVRRETRRPITITDSSKSSTSIMFSGTASGELLNVYVVYKAQNMYPTWTEGGPPGTRYGFSPSGWFDGPLFEDWFFKVAVRYFRRFDKEEPKVMIGDNLASHVSVTVLKACREMNIRFVLLPPNSTHLTQPLDYSYFGPLKREWRLILRNWKLKNRGVVPKTTFPSLLKKLIDNVSHEANLRSGFRACGIYPLDSSQVLKNLPSEASSLPNTSNREGIVENFQAFLKDLREKETRPRTARGKKLKVTPGRSVAAEDSSSESDSDNVSYAESGDSLETFSDLENDETMDEIPAIDLPSVSTGKRGRPPGKRATENSKQDEGKKSLEPAKLPSLQVDDFIYVKLTYNSSKKNPIFKHFYAQILSIIDNKHFECKFLRQKGDKYVFPNVNDIEIVVFDTIIRKVDNVTEKRGIYTFN
jgi:hypothetical protein